MAGFFGKCNQVDLIGHTSHALTWPARWRKETQWEITPSSVSKQCLWGQIRGLFACVDMAFIWKFHSERVTMFVLCSSLYSLLVDVIQMPVACTSHSQFSQAPRFESAEMRCRIESAGLALLGHTCHQDLQTKSGITIPLVHSQHFPSESNGSLLVKVLNRRASLTPVKKLDYIYTQLSCRHIMSSRHEQVLFD